MNPRRTTARPRWLALIACLATTLLVACGEDASEAGAGGAGSGGFGTIGRVDGFGSVQIEGATVADSQARVTLDENPLDPRAVPLSSIRLGAQISASIDQGALLDAAVGAEILGRVDVVPTSLDVISVEGQTVRLLGGHPVLKPVFSSLTQLQAGTLLEIHGQRLANGALLATRVEVRPFAATALVRLAGPVSQLDSAQRRFNIGRRVVDYRQAIVLPVTAGPLANGQRVVVFANESERGRPLVAEVLRQDSSAAPATSGELRIGGLVTGFSGGPRLFVRGIAVDTSEARFTGAGAAALQDDRFVRVRGPVRDGVLRASEVEVLTDAAQLPTRVAGAVTDYAGSDTLFRLRGANVRIGAGTTFANGSRDNLAAGVRLAVVGDLDGGEVRATRIEFRPGSPVLAGRASAVDRAAGTLVLGPFGQAVRLTPATTLRNGSAAELADGRLLRVSGRPDGATLVADELSFLDAPGQPPEFLLMGVTSDPINERAIYVGDTLVQYGPQTQVVVDGRAGTPDDLNDGYFAIVRAVRQDGQVVARRVELRQNLLVTQFTYGYIDEFTSAQRFRVVGQAVDASAAQFVGLAPADLRANRFVLVEGPVDDGVLRARRVELLAD